MTRRPARHTTTLARVLFPVIPVRAVVLGDHRDGCTGTGWEWHGRTARDSRGRHAPRMREMHWLILWCSDPYCYIRVDVHDDILRTVAGAAIRQHARDVQSRAAEQRTAPTPTTGPPDDLHPADRVL